VYVRELENKEVISKDGAVMGKTTNTMIDTSEWRVVSIEISLDDKIAEELQMKKMFRSTNVGFPVDQVEAVGDTILLKAKKDDMASILFAPKQHTAEAQVQ
jgi:sporulation protein YlmC with PRC-barrel domain